MKKRAVIFGTTDFAEVAYVYLTQDSPYKVDAFTVHERFIRTPQLLGVDVVPFETIEDRFPASDYAMFVAIGFKRVNALRTEMYRLCKAKGYEMVRYVNSKVSSWGHIELGDNTFIFENNVIQPFVRIGNNTVLWSGNHIGHHSTIGNNCFIASHVVVSGHVVIGDNCFLGVNATLRDGVRVANGCVIGAGATILKDTIENGVYPSTSTEAASVRSDQLRNF
jgi:sugar O-acyltransferase (sialic acid O-acetyltransferase NeuD family)